jgi:hypothetical protein
VLDEVPDVFRSCVEESAFSDEDGMPLVTACVWRETGADGWRAGRLTSRRDGGGSGWFRIPLPAVGRPVAGGVFGSGPRTITRFRSIWTPFVMCSLHGR